MKNLIRFFLVIPTTIKIHFLFTVLLLFAIAFYFWPYLILDLINSIRATSFITQTFAVGLGVFGGMWMNKRLEAQKSIKVMMGALEIIEAELQSNTNVASNIQKAIRTRPSLAIRDYYSSADLYKLQDMELDQILKYSRTDEEMIKKYSAQLTDKGYYIALPLLSGIKNRKLISKLINTYRYIRVSQTAFGIVTLGFGMLTNTKEQKIGVVNFGDRQFSRLSTILNKIEQRTKAAHDELFTEITAIVDSSEELSQIYERKK